MLPAEIIFTNSKCCRKGNPQTIKVFFNRSRLQRRIPRPPSIRHSTSITPLVTTQISKILNIFHLSRRRNTMTCRKWRLRTLIVLNGKHKTTSIRTSLTWIYNNMRWVCLNSKRVMLTTVTFPWTLSCKFMK